MGRTKRTPVRCSEAGKSQVLASVDKRQETIKEGVNQAQKEKQAQEDNRGFPTSPSKSTQAKRRRVEALAKKKRQPEATEAVSSSSNFALDQFLSSTFSSAVRAGRRMKLESDTNSDTNDSDDQEYKPPPQEKSNTKKKAKPTKAKITSNSPTAKAKPRAKASSSEIYDTFSEDEEPLPRSSRPSKIKPANKSKRLFIEDDDED
ncbi:expressed unknown protein [Seminavis robusta]|uniref:Uncharacterized protein n=1 Tax=Seminavis robusta TaxID=568900 RepID=A0A9N8ECB6_9STRA|nr:expressed unknown protein [Seminavis robusta]|eukprot:Sro939_g222450.1 n/a (204) ;mRNA; r:24431-25042